MVLLTILSMLGGNFWKWLVGILGTRKVGNCIYLNIPDNDNGDKECWYYSYFLHSQFCIWWTITFGFLIYLKLLKTFQNFQHFLIPLSLWYSVYIETSLSTVHIQVPCSSAHVPYLEKIWTKDPIIISNESKVTISI